MGFGCIMPRYAQLHQSDTKPTCWVAMTMQLLLKGHAVPIDVPNWEGYTPLCCAFAWGHLDVAKYLLKNGADGNYTTATGMTPLHIAAWHNCTASVDWLLQHGAESFETSRFGVRAFDMTRPGQARRSLYASMYQQPEEPEPMPAPKSSLSRSASVRQSVAKSPRAHA